MLIDEALHELEGAWRVWRAGHVACAECAGRLPLLASGESGGPKPIPGGSTEQALEACPLIQAWAVLEGRRPPFWRGGDVHPPCWRGGDVHPHVTVSTGVVASMFAVTGPSPPVLPTTIDEARCIVAARLLRASLIVTCVACACDLDWWFDWSGHATWDAAVAYLRDSRLPPWRQHLPVLGPGLRAMALEESITWRLHTRTSMGVWRVLQRRGFRMSDSALQGLCICTITNAILPAIVECVPPEQRRMGQCPVIVALCVLRRRKHKSMTPHQQLAAVMVDEHGIDASCVGSWRGMWRKLGNTSLLRVCDVAALMAVGWLRPAELAAVGRVVSHRTRRWRTDDAVMAWRAGLREYGWTRRLPALCRHVRVHRIAAGK